MVACFSEQFPALEALPVVRATFLCRCPGIDVQVGREEVLKRLEGAHRLAAEALGFAGMPIARAAQVHGSGVEVVESGGLAAGVDGLVTSVKGLALAITVADCAAVYLADRSGRAVGLVHSGKKGTELGIAPKAVQLLCDNFGCDPARLVAVVSPCIRPPNYEVDFAAEIHRQLTEAGVGEIHDQQTCTDANPERYYSYRREKGRTGRMLALLALTCSTKPD